MSYIRHSDLGQTAGAPATQTGTTVVQQREFSTGEMITGIVGAVLSAGAPIAAALVTADAERKIAKEKAKSEERQLQIQADLQKQLAAQQAAMMAAMPQPAPEPPIDMTKIAVVGGVGLAAVALVGVIVSASKGKKKDQAPQWGPPPPWQYGPPAGYGPPPGYGPQPGYGPPQARNKPRRRKVA